MQHHAATTVAEYSSKSIVFVGTNVMIRARACFLACKFGEQDQRRSSNGGALKSGTRSRQLFSEVLVAEDVDLGSRIHALGYKSVFLNEVLARGEVRSVLISSELLGWLGHVHSFCGYFCVASWAGQTVEANDRRRCQLAVTRKHRPRMHCACRHAAAAAVFNQSKHTE